MKLKDRLEDMVREAYGPIDYSRQIQACMVKLDIQYPGWRDHVDIQLLDMESDEMDLLTQIGRGHYKKHPGQWDDMSSVGGHVADMARIGLSKYEEYGLAIFSRLHRGEKFFDARDGRHSPDYADLTRQWKLALEK